MKIGILTFHRAHNYGALLQCYSLKEYISSLGHEVSIIDYWPDYHSKTYNLIPDFTTKSFKGKIKSLITFSINFYKIYKRYKGYNLFIEEYLNLTNEVKYKTAIELQTLEFDIVVYGSDQIWWKSTLPSFKGFDLVYWGEYLTKTIKKISYAPSMGVMNYTDEEIKLFKTMLNNFNLISVREIAAQELLTKKMNIESELVLDPVFLLDKNKWIKLCDTTHSPIQNNEKYIFFYQLMKDNEACLIVKQAAEHFGCRVIEVRGRVEAFKLSKRYLHTIDPIGFIQLIRNAHFIVSTSFHGTAFSIIMEKQFIATGMANNSERARSLLTNLEIKNRYVTNAKNVDFIEKINYEQVNMKLIDLKCKSINFLNKNL